MENKKSSVPKLRFPGFTGAWEQRKLGEVATRVTRKNKNLESTLPLTISAQLGLVDQISYFDKRIASSNLTNYILLKRGEFAYNKSYSNGYPFGAVKRLNNYASGVIPSLYIAFFPNNKTVNSNFMETYFETNLWHKEVSTRATEGARNHGLLNISPTDFMDINIRIPMIMKEQVEITKFLHNVDTLITLHQRKLEHLKEQKKGLLQKMFPKNGEVVPEVRFPGFTDDWEQRKLSELIQKGGSGGTPKSTNKAYYNGNIPFLGISDISKSNGYIDDTEKYISEKGLDNSSAWIVPKGAISLAMYASVGKLAILNTDAATSQAFYNMVFEDVSIRDYIYHRLGKANEFGEWTRLISTGTQSNLNADKVKNFKIQIPQIIDEIKNISTFFNQLDSLIALHQRKLEHLKLMKKGLLQQMFV